MFDYARIAAARFAVCVQDERGRYGSEDDYRLIHDDSAGYAGVAQSSHVTLPIMDPAARGEWIENQWPLGTVAPSPVTEASASSS
jgi:hypothetical protein